MKEYLSNVTWDKNEEEDKEINDNSTNDDSKQIKKFRKRIKGLT